MTQTTYTIAYHRSGPQCEAVESLVFELGGSLTRRGNKANASHRCSYRLTTTADQAKRLANLGARVTAR